MRSALKRDLDENVVPQQAGESGAPAEGQANEVTASRPKAQRYARPRIVETKARDARAAAPETVAAARPAGKPQPEAGQPEPVDALMSDLQRIMASLEAQRRVETPPSAPAAPPDTAGSADEDTRPLGAVAAAALRAFREGGVGERSGAGARLIAEEAARIAVERRNMTRPISEQTASEASAEEMLLAPPAPSDDEPYVYVAGALAAPPAPVPAAAPAVAPVRDREDPARAFIPLRHRSADVEARAVAAPSQVESADFAFDINAFVDELEREAEDAGREWNGEDGEAMFAGGRAPLDARKTLPPVDEVAEAPVVEMPSVEAAIARALAIDEHAEVSSALVNWEPEVREHAAAAIAPAPARHARADSFTWKRFALLGLIAVGAIGAGIALQSVAARNDSGAAEPADSAEVANVAPTSEAVGAPAPPAPAVRNVTPKAAEQVVQDGSTPATPVAPGAELAAVDQPLDQPMDQALSGQGRDASSVATPDAAVAPDAQASELPVAPEASADDAQASDAAPMDAPASEDTAAVAPPSAPKPAPRAAAKPTVAAATPAARAPAPAVSNAAPSGTATIKSGVTMRSGPDNKAGAVATLKTGQKVDLVSCKMWCEVVADGKRGFVFKKFVETGVAAQ